MSMFLITLNMPNGSGKNLVHQVVAEHPAASIQEFCEELNDRTFVVVRQWYFQVDPLTGRRERDMIDRGDLILNADHIGKVAVYYDPGKG